MKFTEKIFACKAEIAALEVELTSQLSEQKEHDIQLQIIAKENLLTELYKLNAATGKKHSTRSILGIPTN